MTDPTLPQHDHATADTKLANTRPIPARPTSPGFSSPEQQRHIRNTDQIKPFFIFGSPRSGTSLLSRMLDSHENLLVPQESLLFKMFYGFSRYYGDLSIRKNQELLLQDMLKTMVIGYWNPAPRLKDALSALNRPGFGAVVEALIRSTSRGKPLRLWGEKTPGHVFYWNQIRSEYPDVKVVHIVRDGRDVAGSLLKARMGPKTYFAAAKLWCSYLDAIEFVRRDCRSSDFIEIRYEDLLERPKQTLTAVCETLGVAYSDRMLAFHEKEELYLTDAVNQTNLQSPLMTANKEKWRTAMTPKDIQEFETIADQHLREYGYQPANRLGPLPQFKQIMLGALISPAIRFLARAKDTKGQKEFVNLQFIKARRLLAYYMAR